MRLFTPAHGKTQNRRLSRPALLLTAALFLALTAALACGGAAPAPAPAEQSTLPAAAQPTTAATQPPAAPPTTAPTLPPAATVPPAATATAAPEPTNTPAATNPPPAAPTESAPPAAEPLAFTVADGSEATFTVNEKLAWLDLPNDAVMRTQSLSGSVYLDGRPSVIDLDLHSLTSDADRRDRYVRQRMFPDNPTATFTVTDLGDLPHPLPPGEVITRQVAGELAINGVVKPLTFAVEARRDPENLFILGRTTFTWDELEIPPPNIPGRIQVKDEVSVEVLLSTVPANGS